MKINQPPKVLKPLINIAGWENSPLNPNHPAWGKCPSCGETNTIVHEDKIDGEFDRVCLRCGCVEAFNTHHDALVGWSEQLFKQKGRRK